MRHGFSTTILSSALAAVALAAAPSGAVSQSLFSAAGLGYPIVGVDARAVALGSSGVGLFEPILTPAFPAAAADLLLPTLTGTLQSTWGTQEQAGSEADIQGSRFPMMGIAYPVRGIGVATLTFEGVLDQRWQVSRQGSVPLSGEEIEVLDRFASDGGVSAVRLGWGQRVGDDLAVGASVGYHIGHTTRTFRRSFDTLAVGSQVSSFNRLGRWELTGPTASAGILWDVGSIARIGANVVWSGSLDAEPDGGDAEESREFDLPLRFQGGANVVLAPDLSLSVSVDYADWSDAAEDLTRGRADAVWHLGGGVEWEGPRFLGRDFPVRLGYRRSDLPFALGQGDATESVFSGGVGITLAQAQDIPLARIEASLQRGTREDDLLSESFWRTSLTLRVSGR